jgi:hypothetical protein
MSYMRPGPFAVLSDEGRALLKIKTARAASHFIPHGAEEPAPPTLDLDSAIAVALRSATFGAVWTNARRAGWAIRLARGGEPTGVFKGPHLIALEPAPPSALAARLAHQVALAVALAAPLPIRAPDDPRFVRKNAAWFLKQDGAARLLAAIVRDEILATGGPDIGGPGLRGEQLRVFEAFKRGRLPWAATVERIGLSRDSLEARGFTTADGPRIARNLASAFVAPPREVDGDAGGREVIARICRMRRRARPLTASTVAAGLGVVLCKTSADGEVITHEGELAPRLAEVSLRTPVFGGDARIVVWLRGEAALGYESFVSRFGPCEPHHVDSSDRPRATVMCVRPVGRVYATFAPETGVVHAITVEGPSS